MNNYQEAEGYVAQMEDDEAKALCARLLAMLMADTNRPVASIVEEADDRFYRL